MRYRLHTQTSGTWTTYWFEKNMFGDVVAVYSSAGTKLVSYKYDAWGNFTTTTHATDSIGGAAKNPFRYRGYYYDSDLGFYVTGTRYYDPAIGRFISPDAYDVITATPTALTDKNLYAYCDNNPVMRVDHGGEFWITAILVGAVIGAVINASVSAISQKVTEGSVNWLEVGVSAATGALSGAVAATGIGALGSGAINAAIDGTEYLVTQSINGEEIDEKTLFATMAIGAVTAGKGINSSKLKGIYSHSKSVLKSAVSDRKIAMYENKIVSVKRKVGEYIVGELRDGALTVGTEWLRSRFIIAREFR